MKNEVVLITGGATGIGFSFAKNLGLMGAKIVIASRRESVIKNALTKLESEGIDASGTTCDVANIEEVSNLADFAWNAYGKVTMVLNNAGVVAPFTTVIDIEERDIDRVIDINLKGVWNVIKVFGKRLVEQRQPCMLYSMGSENSLFDGLPLGNAYVVSKHAVYGLMEVFRKEVPDFFHVGIICPGLINSELGDGINFGMDTDEFTKLAIKQILNKEYYVVSHAYNMDYITNRYNEIKKSFEQYAPRYEGDVKLDSRVIIKKIFKK